MNNRTACYACRMLMNAFRWKGKHLHTDLKAVLRDSRFTKLKYAGITAGCRPNVCGILFGTDRDDMGYPDEYAADARNWIMRLT